MKSTMMENEQYAQGIDVQNRTRILKAEEHQQKEPEEKSSELPQSTAMVTKNEGQGDDSTNSADNPLIRGI